MYLFCGISVLLLVIYLLNWWWNLIFTFLWSQSKHLLHNLWTMISIHGQVCSVLELQDMQVKGLQILELTSYQDFSSCCWWRICLGSQSSFCDIHVMWYNNCRNNKWIHNLELLGWFWNFFFIVFIFIYIYFQSIQQKI